MEDDWDLQAVVRSCSATTTSTTATATATIQTSSTDLPPSSIFQPQQMDDQFLFFPDLFEARSERIEELHDLYKPFFTKLQPCSPQTIPISPLSVLGVLPNQSQLQKQFQTEHSVGGSRSAIASAATARQSQSQRSKRRKNQMKKVCQVAAEDLSSDMWSWRKYGQKPIKGSPYPRGYYRCSTSKACLARKQVERDRSDPGMFIVTYTADHNHPVPTHRNSLAGSTRQKTVNAVDSNKPSCSSPVSPAASLSPVTEKSESREEREDTVEEEDDDEFDLSDVVMSDDFFVGMEELAGPDAGDSFSENSPASSPFPWLAKSATTTAGVGG